MAHKSDAELIETTRNVARFFTENRQISWVLLVAVVIWGVYAFQTMPKRKDPRIPVRVAVASCAWPGVDAEKVEQFVTRPIEQTLAQSSSLHEPGPGNSFAIKSTTLPGLTIVNVQLGETVPNMKAVFNQMGVDLEALNASLPAGAGPIQFNADFGETAALMLTVASPKETEIEVSLRARDVARAIRRARARGPATLPRTAVVVALPRSIDPAVSGRILDLLNHAVSAAGIGGDIVPLQGGGFAGLDAEFSVDDTELLAFLKRFGRRQLGATGLHPDAWQPTLIRDPAEARKKLAEVVGDKYSYAELDDFTSLIARTLQNLTPVAKVTRSGTLPQQIHLSYSQEQLASYGLRPSKLKSILGARNITAGAGVLEAEGANLILDPSGAFESPDEIGGVMIARAPGGVPVYLRDLVDVVPGYQNPPNFLNFFSTQDDAGEWRRSRAITLAVQMRPGGQVAKFGVAIDEALAEVGDLLPGDLVMARTSDQPRQVEENLELFMNALAEAIILVVLVAWIGFWEWRSALLMMLAIPVTLAMTFGMISTLGVELQQVSIAALIIALGLLVDDPVVAGDAIKRSLAQGHSRLVAAWLGPTRLANAIMFATVTNVVAYLPFLLLPGNSGTFVHSLPIVMACALIASRLVSMTFVPLLGYYLLRAPKELEPPIEERREHGFTGFYYRIGSSLLEHRHRWLILSLIFLVAGLMLGRQLKTAYFPNDIQYFSYVDVWLPAGSALSATNEITVLAEEVVHEVVDEYQRSLPERDGSRREVLRSLTSFVGGAAPRFWFSIPRELQQLNYAQIILEVSDKHDTPKLAGRLQRAFEARIPGAQLEMHQLETNPVGHPVAIEISGRATVNAEQERADILVLRDLARKVEDIFREVPVAGLVRDDWFDESFVVKLKVDPDRANLAGITNADVARSSAAGISGTPVGVLLEANKQIPIVARLRAQERAQISDLRNLYVYAAENPSKVPLLEVASIRYQLETQRIARREHFRTITVVCLPTEGTLPSQVLKAARPQLDALIASLPPGYRLTFAGEQAKQQKGFGNLVTVMLISIAGIFLALVLQFKHAFKPLLVFSAVPFGAVGAMLALYLSGSPFGFMAFLGIVALIGVIVSHVIVLFDFIEENHAKGDPLRESLLDAGIVRLRPVMITVGATAIALVPLAIHGGPLWQPLCYAQIGGLSLATFIELLLVKVYYVIFVKDLKLVRWDHPDSGNPTPTADPMAPSARQRG